MLTMFSPGPKSRTTAALLAIGLGWAGIHKFYLGYRDVGVVHAALTWLGVVVILAQAFLPGSISFLMLIVAWAAIILGYVYIRRFQLGHTMQEVASPGRLLLWPWQLVRRTFGLVRTGSDIMSEEEEERRERRWERRMGRRGRRRRSGRRNRWGDDDDGGGFSFGCVMIVLGTIACLAIAAVIILVYYLIFTIVGFIALAGSIVIGVAEGVIYLRKTDSEFQSAYVVGRRLWV